MTPSNSPRPPIVDGAGRRAERRHDPGQHAVALLPVEAGHVERNLRALRPRRAALELDVGLLGRGPAGAMRDPLGVERVGDRAGDRHVAERQMRVERARLRGSGSTFAISVRRQLPRHRRDARRHRRGDFAVAVLQRQLPERPLEPVVAGGAARETDALQSRGSRSAASDRRRCTSCPRRAASARPFSPSGSIGSRTARGRRRARCVTSVTRNASVVQSSEP